MQTSGAVAPVRFIYQACVTQTTGEDWKNVTLYLETAQPTYGLQPLGPWFITHQEPPVSPMVLLPKDADIDPNQSIDSYYVYETSSAMDMKSTREVGTTIKVPGLLNIMTNQKEHCVNVVELDLEAKISWICVPKSDRSVYLEAEITNLSKYTLRPGLAKVYMGESFMSCTEIAAAVSPKELFKCPLGADPSVRITYFRREKDQAVVKSGFFRKKLVHHFTRRISIHNAKSLPIHGIRITDYIHVSDDPDISVTLLSPALAPSLFPPSTTAATTTTGKGSSSLPRGAEVSISDGVRAMWRGVSELENGLSSQTVAYHDLGKDGTIEWLCDLPGFGCVDLVLEWKVATTRAKKVIYGL